MGRLQITFSHFISFNPFPNKPWLLCVLVFNKSFENTVGKEEIAHNERESFLPFTTNLELSSHTHSVRKSKICP